MQIPLLPVLSSLFFHSLSVHRYQMAAEEGNAEKKKMVGTIFNYIQCEIYFLHTQIKFILIEEVLRTFTEVSTTTTISNTIKSTAIEKVCQCYHHRQIHDGWLALHESSQDNRFK